VLVATGIIVLVLLVLILLIKPSTNVKEKVKAQIAELAKFKLEEEVKVKQVEMVQLKQEEEAKVKQMELVQLKQEEEAKVKQMELVKSKEVANVIKVAAGIEKDLVLIPVGKFMMGSPASEKGRREYETQHEVTLTKPFYMGKYEVTQEQWESVMGSNPSSTKGAKLPVTNVSWEDCQYFIKKLNLKTNGGYRLPTEAEWEYACRAGTSTVYSVGSSLTNIDANIEGGGIKEVGSYNANAFGLYDMHGNVWEWCNDDWKADYPAGAVTDPKGPGTGTSRVLRGGSFNSYEFYARSSGRSGYSPSIRYIDNGLRLARTP
jgi:formylglycine-generating enzyme required for sulfatase activity